MRARVDHGIDWHSYFILDEKSPSGLVWKFDTANHKRRAGDVAGNLRLHKGGIYYWVLEIQNKSFMVHRIIWEMKHGEIPEGWIVDHLDGNGANNSLNNLKAKLPRLNATNKKKQCDNTSGVTGVYLNIKTSRNGDKIYYWMASWVDNELKQKTKCFNINKLGEEDAFQKACDYRALKIKELSENGVTYTERHGK